MLEALWLASGGVGAAITVANLRDSFRDRTRVDELHNDPAIHERHWQMIRLAATGRRDSQWTRLVICLLICLTGIVGVLQANPLGGRTTWTGLTVTVALVAIAVLTAHRSWRDYTQRGQMFDLARGRTAVIAAELRARNLPPS